MPRDPLNQLGPFLVSVTQTYARSAAIFVNEFDAGGL
jgi:hypothetical protein